MIDIFLSALQSTKSINEFDLNYAIICAELSNQAYNTIAQQKSYLLNYGFTNIQVIAHQGASVTVACYSNDLYIAFMGTNFSNINDVLADLDAGWSIEGKGKAYSGFKDYIDLLWVDIKTYIHLTDYNQIIITGHSMGGAAGQIANYRLRNSIGYFFGAARVVDKNIVLDNKSTVFQLRHQFDIVPHLPFSLLGYKILGEVFMIENNQIVPKPDKWYDLIYSVGYTLAYFTMLIISKITGGQDHLSDLVLQQHQVAGYLSDIENISSQ